MKALVFVGGTLAMLAVFIGLQLIGLCCGDREA